MDSQGKSRWSPAPARHRPRHRAGARAPGRARASAQRPAPTVRTSIECGAQSAREFEARGVPLDVTEQASIDAALTAAEAAWGAPSILVNNAGITRDNLLMRHEDEEWDAMIDTNLEFGLPPERACLRGMIKARKGRIVNIASVVGFTGNAGQTNYAAAKAGMIGFTHSLAREVGSRGITVNVVAPGFIETDMTRALAAEQRAALIAQMPVGRLGQAEDIAQCRGVSGSPRAALYHGRDAARQRRDVHGVNGGRRRTVVQCPIGVGRRRIKCMIWAR